jgi:CHAT domain-containing protein/Tfp pilus assembly protein PilF
MIKKLALPPGFLLVLCVLFLHPPVLAQTVSEADAARKEITRLVIEAAKPEAKRDYATALPMLQQALAIAEKAFGADALMVYICLKPIGTLYTDKGDFELAEPILRRALGIIEKHADLSKTETAQALHNLAVVYDDLGDYGRAEPLYERALALREEALGPNSLKAAESTNFLANLYQEKGDYLRAAALFQRAMEINEKLANPDQMLIATLLNNQAYVYEAQKEHTKAEQLYLRAIAITENTKPESVDLATFLNNLGVMYIGTDYKKARPILERALALREKLLGPNHADVGNTINNLAMLSWREGDLQKTEQSLLRALSIAEKTHGPTHPDVGAVLNNVAFLYQAKGDIAQAVSFFTRANDVFEHNLALILTKGTEEQKRLYMATLTNETSATVSLHVNYAPGSVVAARLALTTILQRKGRILDESSDQLASLRRHLSPPDQLLLDQLSFSRAQLATLVLKGPDSDDPAHYAAAIKKLESETQALEKKVAARAGEFRLQTEPITIELIQASIPRDFTLVEIARYRPVIVKIGQDAAWNADRYVAYVLQHSGEPSWVDLGDAAKIDRDAARLRTALRNPRRADFRELARVVDEEVMQPVRKLLGGSRQILISPDSALNLVPLSALVDEQEHYLVENYTFTYLTSGRDLLRLQSSLPSRQGPVVIADPQFDDLDKSSAAITPSPQSSGTRSRDFQERFLPLEATAEEARAVSSLLGGATLLLGRQATETALKQVSGPSILHVATHGFFLPAPQADKTAARGQGSLSGLSGSSPTLSENPLLRSGLALAGANQRQGGDGEDGILTALEAAGLDLWGTKLVVLSACETGIGDVQNGEGVYGLRRALVLAGAESELMSLWKVDDEATRDLMNGFYKNLEAGMGRTEALRQIQLSLLKSTDHNHPFFWAAFILSGDWRSLKTH